MKFLTSILGSERDRAAKKRRSLEVNLHRLEEKAFLLEMELEETRRQKEKVIKELRNGLPVRHVSTVSVSSTDMSFNTDSSNVTDHYCGLPIDSSTPKETSKRDFQQKHEQYAEEEGERAKWQSSAKLGEKSEKSEKSIEKY
ncbi:Lzipper-MIP1 domain-containing protein [Caenorhabditis elegans]|uniref:Lzipper-MIP1 domain-containing protein n=1 Tax=Caenorhabditis elegans TaxID=6239 RepID=Q9N3I5_CAEEL|nr:Lzipper-MIP1 domain-containing protein [Caenorhabditis elegans]CCD71789.1 Lzipper-MIP1 domain-containing protein [Caenorhabditis elegans]|eukprot:NP_493973.1 Uncharacterized protein CELE_Y51H7C.3 [Caenorhabditis elegans]